MNGWREKLIQDFSLTLHCKCNTSSPTPSTFSPTKAPTKNPTIKSPTSNQLVNQLPLVSLVQISILFLVALLNLLICIC